jgi:hypothetical protein
MCGMCETLDKFRARSGISIVLFEFAGSGRSGGQAGGAKGFPQAARSAVEMWKLEFLQIAPFSSFGPLAEGLVLS